MPILFIILIILASVILGLIILVQNPKGGGLAANVGGFSNQLMGVKQTTDVLEKGTWILATTVALLCLFSVMFVPKSSGIQVRDVKPNAASSVPAAPATQQQLPVSQPKK
jgi:preprotein translocase subunit SecG